MPRIERHADLAALTSAAHAEVKQIAEQSIAARGRFAIALCGGSTPRGLYRALANDPGIDWAHWWLFWGDERSVPPDHAESNYHLVRENLLDHLSVAPGMVLSPVAGEFALLPPAEQAEAYDDAIRQAFEDPLPQFDLNLLGMGGDGHTASLFPFTRALGERERLVVANEVAKLNTTRITFTFPLINASRRILFLVAGIDKATALHEVLEGKQDPNKYPSQDVRRDNTVTWFVDEAAAAHLA